MTHFRDTKLFKKFSAPSLACFPVEIASCLQNSEQILLAALDQTGRDWSGPIGVCSASRSSTPSHLHTKGLTLLETIVTLGQVSLAYFFKGGFGWLLQRAESARCG